MLKLAKVCVSKDLSLQELLKLTFHKDAVIAFRAAWILEHIMLTTHWSSEDILYFLDHFYMQKNNSCRRHYTKLMCHIFKTYEMPDGISYDNIIECSLEWLVDPKVPVAVKANCIDILYALRDENNWLKEELTFQMQFMLMSGSAAIQCRAKKFLALVAKEQKL